MRNRSVIRFTAAVLAAAVLAGAGGPARADRDATTPTNWLWFSSISADDLTTRVESGYRITDLEVVSAAPLRFAAVLVRNTGTYATSWHWYYGLTATQAANLAVVANGTDRVLDVDSYLTGGQRRYAVVTVSNKGSKKVSWWWYLNATPSFISGTLSGRRIVDLDPTAGSSGKYDVVQVSNAGASASAWWYYFKRSPSQVKALLATNKARLVDIESDGSGLFTVVMRKTSGQYWWWYQAKTVAQLTELAAQHGARIVDVERHSVSGQTRYAAIMLNNVGAEVSRLRELMAKGLSGASYGFYLKRVGGGVVHGLQQSKIFEPASSIKVLYNLHAFRQVEAGNDFLDRTNFEYYVNPSDPTNEGICPLPEYEVEDNKVTTTMQDGLEKMMQDSDNRTTRGVELRYSRAAINATAIPAGMANTALRQTIGCGFDNNLRNDLTLEDAAKLYEGVEDRTLLDTTVEDFYGVMNGGTPTMNSGLAAVITDEAGKVNKAAKANALRLETRIRSKGGSYDICGATCASYTYIRTQAGTVWVPFKTAAGIERRAYVFGYFGDGLVIDCQVQMAGETTEQNENRCAAFKAANVAIRAVAREMFRTVIRAALTTW